jgi:tetratricopeptide (TPR) repeat protein
LKESQTVWRTLLFLICMTVAARAQTQNAHLESLLAEEAQLMASARAGGVSTVELSSTRFLIGKAYLAAGRYREAFDYLHNAAQLRPADPDRWTLLGDAAHFLGHPAAKYVAQYAYEEALKRAPGQQETRLKLGSTLLATEQFQKAITEFETALANGATGGWNHALGLLMLAYAEAGELGRGVRFFESAGGRSKDPRFRLAAAVLRRAQGEEAEARQLLRELQAGAGGETAQAAARLLAQQGKGGEK